MHTIRNPFQRLRAVKWPAVALLAVACSWAALGAAALAPGKWAGEIELPGAKLAIEVALAQADGAWSGKISIPAQGAKDLPLGGVKVEGPAVSFEMPGVPGSPLFKGILSDDGQALAGTFTQSGQSFPFHIAIGAAPAAPAPVDPAAQPGPAAPPAPGAPPALPAPPTAAAAVPPAAGAAPAAAGVEGHWEGTIDLAGTKLAFDVDLRKKGDGSWSGDISIPAQGASNLPLSNVRSDGAEVTFEISSETPGIAGDPTFKGKLAPDGRSVTGDFTQGGGTFPFRMDSRPSPSASAREALKDFDGLVEKTMKDWKVPGLALVVVRDGEVVVSKGYGLRNTDRKLPVTPKTLFAIGSSTKAFTTFVMGTLVDDGAMEWDQPLVTYLPTFRLADASASERITPRDLVTHRSGLPRHDLVWYNSSMPREAILARLPYLQPTHDLREEWSYQNLMFLTAGVLVEKITGKSWEDNVRERIFNPLAMSASNFSVVESQRSPDYALPYREKDDEVKAIPFRDITTVGPAGAINSNLEDMTKWVLLHLSDGKAEGKQLITAATLADMHLPHMAIARPAERPEIPEQSYGLGWFVEPYRGHNRIHHGGNIDGFSALVSFLPQEKIGIVVLTNLDGTGVPELLSRHAMDRLLGLEPIDWTGEALAKKAVGVQLGKEAKKKKEITRVPGTRLAHALEDYVGEYENPGYGDLKIALASNGRLEALYNGIRTPLDHWHYEVFNGAKGAADPVFEDMKFLFRTGMKGEVDEVEAPFEPEVADIVFKRKPDAELADPAYLQRFLGDYILGPQVLSVSLRGKKLILSAPGQPVYELVPGRKNEFTLKQYSVISVKFTVDPKEGVTEALFDQPNGLFTAKKKKA